MEFCNTYSVEDCTDIFLHCRRVVIVLTNLVTFVMSSWISRFRQPAVRSWLKSTMRKSCVRSMRSECRRKWVLNAWETNGRSVVAGLTFSLDLFFIFFQLRRWVADNWCFEVQFISRFTLRGNWCVTIVNARPLYTCCALGVGRLVFFLV